MRQTSSTVQSTQRALDHGTTEADEQFLLMRGLVHGVILSMVVWTAALYLTLIVI